MCYRYNDKVILSEDTSSLANIHASHPISSLYLINYCTDNQKVSYCLNLVIGLKTVEYTGSFNVSSESMDVNLLFILLILRKEITNLSKRYIRNAVKYLCTLKTPNMPAFTNMVASLYDYPSSSVKNIQEVAI